MSTVINTLEGVKNLQLNEIERASTQLPPGTQTFSISSEQFISVNSEAESDSRICFSFLFSSFSPLQGLFALNRQGHGNVTLCKGNTSQGKGAFGEDQHQETTCNGTIAENAACKEHLLPAKPEEWVGVIPLPREPPANITGLVLHGGLTAQKADLPGKSHISLSS